MKVKDLLEVCDDVLDFGASYELSEDAANGTLYARPGSKYIRNGILPVPEEWFDLEITALGSEESFECDTMIYVVVNTEGLEMEDDEDDDEED